MERLSIEEIIKHCNRHLDRFPSGTRNYQEHESTRAYLQMLRHYQKIGTVEEFAAYKQADSERRLVELPCKVGTPYAGICREQMCIRDRSYINITKNRSNQHGRIYT